MTQYDPNTGREVLRTPTPANPADVVERQRQADQRQRGQATSRHDDVNLSQETYDQAKRTGRTYDDYETWKGKEQEAAGKRKKPEPEKERSKEDRISDALATFEHGLAHNNPRTQAELNELRYLLGIKAPDDKVTDEQRAALHVAPVVANAPTVPRTDKVDYALEPGVKVPATQRVIDLPAVTHHHWRGHQYFMVGDGKPDSDHKADKAVIVDRDRLIVAVV